MAMLLASDLRQYTYCPRIIYYRYCWPDIRPQTYNMEAGRLAHSDEEGREQRRSLRAYGLTDGERVFDCQLESVTLGVRGKVDLVIYREHEVIPVEYKNSPGRLGPHVLLQLATYGLLLEEAAARPAQRGFVYYIPARRAREIPLDATLKAAVVVTLSAMREMILAERMPLPPPQRNRCEICEFHRFCNDVV